MAYSVLLLNSVVADNIDAYNRSVLAPAALENGNVIYPSALETTDGQTEVWTLTQPATANLTKLWMVWTPEMVLTASKYRNIDPDVQNFVIASGAIADAYKPMVGDLITLTADAMSNAIASNTFINATDGAYDFTWGASASGSTLSYKLVETTYISIGNGALGNTGRVTAYMFECVATA